MLKKLLLGSVGIILIASPLVASAQSVPSSARALQKQTICAALPLLIQEIEALPGGAAIGAELNTVVQEVCATNPTTPSNQPSATITSASGQSTGNFAVTGMFSNTNASSAIVVLVEQSYSGATDWNTIGGLLGGNSTAIMPDGSYIYSYSTAVTGSNHQFSVSFSNIPAGAYTVLVYTGTYNNQTLLTTDLLTVGGSGSSSPTCSIVATPNPANFDQTVTLSWTSQNAVSAQWVPDTSGKDDVAVPTGTPGTSGTATIVASTIGNPHVTLEVIGTDGASAECTATFNVPSPSSNPSTGSIIITDPMQQPYRIVPGGVTSQLIDTPVLQVSGSDAVNVNWIGLALTSGSPSDITRAYIYNGSTLLGSTVFSGGLKYATTTISGFTLQPNQQANLTVRADIANVGIGQAGTPGDLVQINISGVQGFDANSGATVTSTGSTNATGVRIFKSYPTVAQISTPSTIVSNTNQGLISFSVTASPNGPIGINQFAFALSAASGVSVSNEGLYAYTDPAYSQPVAGQNLFGQSASAPMNARFFISTGSSPIEIPAGATYYFQLRGNVSGSGNVALTTMLYGDSSFSGMGGTGNSSFGNFIWSPNDNGTTAVSPSSADWANGFGLFNLPATGISQTITGTGSSTTPTPIPTPAPTPPAGTPPSFSASCTSGTGFLSWSAPSNATPATTYEPIVYVPIADSCPSGWSDGGTSSANQNRECYISGFSGGTTASVPLIQGHSYAAYVYSQSSLGNSATAAGPQYFSCQATSQTASVIESLTGEFTGIEQAFQQFLQER